MLGKRIFRNIKSLLNESSSETKIIYCLSLNFSKREDEFLHHITIYKFELKSNEKNYFDIYCNNNKVYSQTILFCYPFYDSRYYDLSQRYFEITKIWNIFGNKFLVEINEFEKDFKSLSTVRDDLFKIIRYIYGF